MALVTYISGVLLGSTLSSRARRIFFSIGIVANLMVLFTMKYLPSLVINLNSIFKSYALDLQLPFNQILVTIGVSYYVFQSISYLFDVYLQVVEPERHFGYFALYLSFFPKLLQGPIERAGDLLPQLRQEFVFSYDNLRVVS